MTLLVELSFSPAFLTYCLNAALTSTVACAIAIALSRRQAWSLPVRHGMLVAALVVSLAAPLLMPLVELPSLFTVEVFEKVDGSWTSAEPAGAAAVRPRPVSDLPDSADVSVTFKDDPQTIAPLAAVASPPAVVSRSRSAPVPARPRLSATELLRPVGTLLCVVWLAGIFFATGRAIVFLARFKRWQQTIVAADSPPLLEAARWAARRAGLRHEIAIYRCDALPAPVTFGLFRPRVVVPRDIASHLTSDQLRVVLLHEMAHIARRDLWIGLLQQAAQIVVWWNPLVRRINGNVVHSLRRRNAHADGHPRAVPRSAGRMAGDPHRQRQGLRRTRPAARHVPTAQLERSRVAVHDADRSTRPRRNLFG